MNSRQAIWTTAVSVMALLRLQSATTVGAVPGQAAGPATGLWAGVYTTEQALQGENTFVSLCSRCHNPDLSGGQVGASYAPPLGGERFMTRWDSNNVDRLFHTIRDTMPRGTPGMLNDDSALSLVAYILRFNGYPAGPNALTTGPAFEALTFAPKEGAVVKRDVGNFALVAVVGCLSDAGRSWTLTQGSDPVPAREGASGLVKGAALGTQTFRLVSLASFRTALESGRAVQVRGLIRKDPDETLINVTAMDPVTLPCSAARP